MRRKHMEHRASEEKAQFEVGSVKALKPEEEAGLRGTEVLTSIEACMHACCDIFSKIQGARSSLALHIRFWSLAQVH